MLKLLNRLYLPSHYRKKWIYFRILSKITFIPIRKDLTLYVFMIMLFSLEYSLHWIVFSYGLLMWFCKFSYDFLYFVVNHLLFFAVLRSIELFIGSFTFYGVFCFVVLSFNLHLQVVFVVFSVNNWTVYWFFIISLIRMNFDPQNIKKSFIGVCILLFYVILLHFWVFSPLLMCGWPLLHFGCVCSAPILMRTRVRLTS